MTDTDRPALVVPFTKMSGAGNDFVVLDNRFLRFSLDELEALAARVCPRRTGVGADGLLALEGADLEGADGAHFRMRYRNADGSLGTMCGNGARCLARFAARAGLGEPGGGTVSLAFQTDGGDYRARVDGRGGSGPVTLEVPPARDLGPVEVETDFQATRVWTGTEHAVLFVDDVLEVDVPGIGPALRHDPAFEPTGANVDFVEVAGPSRLVVRTFEKGVEAETLACGTGAVASAVVAHHAGHVGERVEVQMPGGTLVVGLGPDGQPETLAGPAETVFEGTLEWRGA